MMMISCRVTETYATTFEGRLTGAQLKALVLKALAIEVGACAGNGDVVDDLELELTIGEKLMPTAWPDGHFTLTRDHLKRDAMKRQAAALGGERFRLND